MAKGRTLENRNVTTESRRKNPNNKKERVSPLDENYENDVSGNVGGKKIQTRVTKCPMLLRCQVN